MNHSMKEYVAPFATLLLCLFSSAACSDGPTDAGNADDGGDRDGSNVGAGCDPNAATAYPPGPYGQEVGAVIRDFCIRGFASPDVSALTPMALHDFHDSSGSSGRSFLWLSGTEMWCDPCNRQTAEYGATVQLLAGKTVAFFQVIFTGLKVGMGPTEFELKVWKDQYQLPFWLAMDEQRLTKENFPQPHPTALLIDTTTMKIVYRMVGFTPAIELAKQIEEYL